MATHVVSCTYQNIGGEDGHAVTLTIDIGNGDSVTTLIKFCKLSDFRSGGERSRVKLAQTAANREAYDLFHALSHSEINEVRLATEDRVTQHNATLSHGAGALTDVPESVDTFFELGRSLS